MSFKKQLENRCTELETKNGIVIEKKPNKLKEPRIGYIVDYGDGVNGYHIQWEYPEISKFSNATVAKFKEVIE